ncbi:hypothetical protein ACFWP2_21755 [Kitasatospora sp. NPDC058444]|uniref:hypothetical protein n=1 Tax=Kitasatospora sp. NPDC058444 TaxID=3346504 RepID=UPI003661F129
MDETTAMPPAPTAEPLQAAVEKPAGPSVRVPVWLVAGLVGFAAGAGAVGLTWGLSSSADPAVPETFTLTGSMSLNTGSTKGAACAGRGGYSDIAMGASVTVYDEGGRVLATGTLGGGKPKSLDGCDFPVTVPNVPKGPQFYQVEVSHRGRISLPKADAEAGLLAVSLG